MPSDRSPRAALLEIVENIQLAKEFINGYDFDRFIDDQRTIYAVTRCLEIISEASRRLPDMLKDRHPLVPWRDIAGSGNVYRHDYENVDDSLLWITVNDGLTRLHEAVVIEIEALQS